MNLFTKALLLFIASPSAFAGEFRAYEPQPQSQEVNCRAEGSQIAVQFPEGQVARFSLRDRPKDVSLAKRKCLTTVLGSARFFLALVDYKTDEGSFPEWTRSQEIALSQNESGALSLVATEELDVRTGKIAPGAKPKLGGTSHLIWGQSSKDQSLMIKIVKQSASIQETVILKLNNSRPWFDFTGEGLE